MLSEIEWVNLVISVFVEDAYWAGLDHFEDYGTEDLKELVTKSDYYGIFSYAARAMAPARPAAGAIPPPLDSRPPPRGPPLRGGTIPPPIEKLKMKPWP